jgi:dihydroorotate dehydrogenase
MLYPLVKNFLFRIDEEVAHNLSMTALGLLTKSRMISRERNFVEDPIALFGLEFPNRIGLAAGFDKDGSHLNALQALGFGFLEVGTVTPKPQPGNPKPRLFRFIGDEAIINRMGFNNKGIENLKKQLTAFKRKVILGINIGKNASTPIEYAADDYLICLREMYTQGDYFTLNISSPNTQGLRNLQIKEALDQLLQKITEEREKLTQKTQVKKPLLVKIAPDIDTDEVKRIVDSLQTFGINGVIATNTTISRPSHLSLGAQAIPGGLSGKPLREKSNSVIQIIYEHCRGDLPIIAVGGITKPEHAIEKLRLGASLVQIYSGLIFYGPSLIKDSAREVKNYFSR